MRGRPFAGRTEAGGPPRARRAHARRRPRAGELRDRRRRARTRRARTTNPARVCIADGDVVLCDFGGTMHGYCSDITRMFSSVSRRRRCATPTRCSSRRRRPGSARPRSACRARRSTPRRATVIAGGRARRAVRPPHRSRHRHGGPRGPVHGRGQRRPRWQPGYAFSVEPGIYVPGPVRAPARGHRGRRRPAARSGSTTLHATSPSSAEPAELQAAQRSCASTSPA